VTALTWARYHPEVADLEKNIVSWPCERIDTGLATVSQPVLAREPKGELFAGGGTRAGTIFNSLDHGKTWSVLCNAASLHPPVPQGFKELFSGCSGVGVSSKGTLLAHWRQAYNDGRDYGGYHDETFHDVVWVTRSEDRGRTWGASPLLDPSPYDTAGGATSPIWEFADGRLLFAVNAAKQPRPGRPLPKSEWIARALAFSSTDDGRTWEQFGCLGKHTDESDLVELPSGRIVACTRYQRKKLPGDPDEMGTPYYYDPAHDRENCWECRDYGPTGIGGHSVYKQTAVLASGDGGRTWTPPRIVTWWLQQTGSLVRLSDGRLILPFSHKDGTQGQRFIVSCDEGETWSKVVYELNQCGMYARSVALEDGTIVTVHDNASGKAPNTLGVLRWNAPPHEETEKHGFFTPREAEV